MIYVSQIRSSPDPVALGIIIVHGQKYLECQLHQNLESYQTKKIVIFVIFVISFSSYLHTE